MLDSAAPSTSTSPVVGSSRLPAIVSSVLLPEPLGPMIATSSPAPTDEVDVAQRVHLVRPVAVDLRHLAQLEHARSSPAPRLRGAGRRRRTGRRRRAAGTGARLSRASAASSQRMTRVEPEHLGVDDQREADVVLGRVLLEARVLLHQLDQVPAVHLHDVAHVDAGQRAARRAP